MKLREWLYQKRMTIRDFSNLIGYNRTYIHAWMSGKKIPSKRIRDKVNEFTMGKVKKVEDLVDEGE